MADFVIVAAAAALLAGTPPVPGAPASTPGTVAAPAPLTAPTAGFRTYPDAASCEQAAANLVAPPGSRFVCLPVEPMAGDMANAY